MEPSCLARGYVAIEEKVHDGVIALQCVGFIGASRVIFQEAFHSHGPGGSFGLGLKDGAVLSHEFIPGKRLEMRTSAKAGLQD